MTVVDTHAWIWWVSEPGRLGAKARRALDNAMRVGVPAISCLEVAALAPATSGSIGHRSSRPFGCNPVDFDLAGGSGKTDDVR